MSSKDETQITDTLTIAQEKPPLTERGFIGTEIVALNMHVFKEPLAQIMASGGIFPSPDVHKAIRHVIKMESKIIARGGLRLWQLRANYETKYGQNFDLVTDEEDDDSGPVSKIDPEMQTSLQLKMFNFRYWEQYQLLKRQIVEGAIIAGGATKRSTLLEERILNAIHRQTTTTNIDKSTRGQRMMPIPISGQD